MANYELNVKINGVEESVSTIGQLETALSGTNQQLQNVETNSVAFTELNNQAQQIQTTFAQVATEAGTVNQQLNGVGQSANKLGDAATATMKLNQEIKETGTSVKQTNSDIQQATNSSTSLRAELRKITLELQNLEPGSARFVELSNRAGQLRDQIQDTNQVIQATAGNTTERFGTALSSTLGIGITGFQGLLGAAQLFGGENEVLQQSLMKLQGLLNLSQSITQLGGLKDQITNITAGFGLFGKAQQATTATTVATTAATGLQATATGTAALATEGATLATGALGTAMSALPIIGIVAALGALTYGIYQYTSSNEEAKKAEEERNKELEAQKAKEEEYATSIATESAEFLQLAYQLKQTTAASQERRTLINQINAEYGSTLQNISDEALFQEQVNNTIKDYIALQVTKYKINENAAEFQKAIKSQVDAERELNQITGQLNKNFMVSADFRKAAQGDYAAETKIINELSKKYRDFNLERTFELQSLRSAQEEYNAAQTQLTTAQNRLQALTKQRVDLVKQERDFLDELFPKRKVDGDLTKSKIDQTKQLTALEKFRLELAREQAQAAAESIIDEAKRTATLVDDIKAQQKVEKDALAQKLADAIKTDAEEVKSKKKKVSEQKKIQDEYDAYIKDLDAKFLERIKIQGELESAERAVIIADLKLQYELLQEEITFGDQSVADSFLALEQMKAEATVKRLDSEISLQAKVVEENGKTEVRGFELSQKEYEAKLQERLVAQKNFLNIDAQLRISEITRQSDLEFSNYQKLLEDEYGLKLKFDKDTILASQQREGESLDQFRERLVQEGKLTAMKDGEDAVVYQQRLDIEFQAYQNLQQTKLNLDKQTATQKELIESETTAKINDAIITADKMTAEKRLKILQDYFTIAKQNLEILAQGSNGAFANLLSGLLDTVDEIQQLTTQKFETTAEKVAAYASVIGSAINSVISAFVQANQDALNEDLKNFEIASNERKDTLTREYNAGLITKEQYDAAIKAQDETLRKQQLEAKKKAFEQDKNLKIAQAIIAGLQGAVAAFAGAMQLGPIAGPIVGGILAGLVATLTAVQVAQIKKQKFDAGGTTVEANIPTASTTAATQVNQASQGGFTGFSENVMGTPQNQTTTTGFTSPGQRVYVLESDITGTQDRVRVLESNSTFG